VPVRGSSVPVAARWSSPLPIRASLFCLIISELSLSVLYERKHLMRKLLCRRRKWTAWCQTSADGPAGCIHGCALSVLGTKVPGVAVSGGRQGAPGLP